MKICYLDCFSGVAGDMLLGALVDAGVDPAHVRAEIAKLGLEGVELKFEPCKRSGISGTNLTVEVAHDHSHRSLSKIEEIIGSSGLDEDVKERSIRIFRRLGEVEAAVHQMPIEKVHFHEVGALDAIVDIVGACVGFKALGIEKVYCSPLNLGSGTVKAAHGVMPVPAPATASLVKDVPTYADGPAVELTTPTGAAIVTTLAESFGAMPAMRIESVGYGAGDREFKGRANLTRVLVGEASSAPEATQIHVIEANVDDMSPEWVGYVRERLLEEGRARRDGHAGLHEEGPAGVYDQRAGPDRGPRAVGRSVAHRDNDHRHSHAHGRAARAGADVAAGRDALRHGQRQGGVGERRGAQRRAGVR